MPELKIARVETFLFDPGTAVSGVFTRSKCPSAAVDWCRERIRSGRASALVVNSGNANAFTGKSGRTATKLTAEIAANVAGFVSWLFQMRAGIPNARFLNVENNKFRLALKPFTYFFESYSKA